MNCAIIDDIPLAIEIIESYLEKVDGATIVSKCTNPIDALKILNNNTIDLVFLDIQMPNLTGIDLVKTLDNPPLFIITTAYPQYALEGFELNAVDYLVKPIPFNRFLKAFNRAQELYNLKQKGDYSSTETNIHSKYIFVKSEYENIKIKIANITYIEGLGEYIKIHSSDTEKPILTLMNFKSILQKLSNNFFLRVHRSYIVNVEHIDFLQKNKIVIANKQIPIGDTYKKELIKNLGI